MNSQKTTRSPNAPITTRAIVVFWYPLALTWLMMAAEAPFLAAVVARLANPTENLAAHGVAFSIAIILEAPVIMILSAATALAKDRASYLKLRRFTYVLNWMVTVLMAGLLVTPGMDWIVRDLIGLPDQVAALVHTALVILLPWPAAIGYRRFYQGVLIRGGKTRLVAVGTVVRLTTMSSVGLVLYLFFEFPGAYVSAAAMSGGVIMEAVAARFMAIGAVRRTLAEPSASDGTGLTYREIMRFYYPLALTSVLSLAVHPMVSFFMGQSRFPLESLAVLPVINGLSFIFRAMGLSFQEVAIALMGDRNQNYPKLRSFMWTLSLGSTLGMALIVMTPMADVWFVGLSGLTSSLAEFALFPAMILTVFPSLSVLLSMQRAILVSSKYTSPITWATVIEVVGIWGMLWLTVGQFHWMGAVAAATSLLVGRIGCNLYLLRPCSIMTRPPANEPSPH